MEPFAYAANIAQGDNARLDTVLLVIALLYNRFDSLSNIDKTIQETVCNSINKQWLSSDQDIFLAAIILNLTHKTRPFAKSSWFSHGQVIILLLRLWTRFFRQAAPANFIHDVPNYLLERGPYASIPDLMDLARKSASCVADGQVC